MHNMIIQSWGKMENLNMLIDKHRVNIGKRQMLKNLSFTHLKVNTTNI